jgi:hypothetical protein
VGECFFFERRETDRRLRSESSMTAFISENIVVTNSTSARHRHINGEGKDHWIAYRNLHNENQPDAPYFLIYFVSQPLHVLGIFIVHHQEVRGWTPKKTGPA